MEMNTDMLGQDFDIQAGPMDHHTIMLAKASLGGKKSNYLKAAVSDELKELLLRKLQIMRMETGRTVSESEYVEQVVAISLLGFEHVQSVQLKQLEKLAGFWSRTATGAPL